VNAGPLPVQTEAGRIAGIDLNKARIRVAPSEALAVAPAPGGFTAAGFTAKGLADKPGRPAAIMSHRAPPAPSPRCSPSATMSSRPSWPGP